MASTAGRRVPEHLYSKKPRSAAGAAAIAGLQSLGETVHDADDSALRALGLQSTDAIALLHVVQASREELFLNPTHLARILRVSSAAATKVIDRLVEAGRVERRPNPKDRRGVVIVPLETAIRDVALAYGHIHVPVVEVIDELSDADAEVLSRFAVRLATALRRANAAD
jgi:DNA-binding MarR family transcriptional regulator